MKIAKHIQNLISDNRFIGVLLLCCTLTSLAISNSPPGYHYLSFWQRETPNYKYVHLPHTYQLFINEVLMTIFFFLVGLEIKKEIISGQLNSAKKALMPVISAVGGMFVPAMIYLIWCHGRDNYTGWGIPMATDIAFSLAVLSLSGKRIPVAMRIFLIAVAIIDDIGSILVIAIFYTSALHLGYLILAAIALILLLTLNYFRFAKLYVYLCAGALLWYFVFNSGIHATIAGVILAFALPHTFTHKLEHALYIPVNFFILPLFVLSNTAIMLPPDMHAAIMSSVHFGVLTGLALGKPLGIFIFTWLAHKCRIAALPVGLTLQHVLGLGIVAGLGFTVSLFITSLAFTDAALQLQAKLAILNAAVISGIAGYTYLRSSTKKKINENA